MKRIVTICIVGIFLYTAFGAGVVTSEVIILDEKNQGNKDFTHTVFAEDGTATWCSYCHYAREALDTIYTSGDYPFYYVCLVDDKNTHAATRINEYNLYGFPTVFFDYGYNVQVGGHTGNEADYRQAITQCGARPIADIDVTLNVNWLGDAAMDISVAVDNNEATPYAGHLHVYVTEVESSLGWADTTGHPYTFPFLDYAFNEPLSIAVGDTWTDSITWDGHNYNSGMGQTYDTIQYGNVAVIAAVFNNTWHQGYAYPPNQNPFNAYYVDDTAGYIVGGGPNPPNNPHPSDGAMDVDIHTEVSWAGGPAGVTYDVYFGTMNPPVKVASNQSVTSYDPGTLSYETTYYWKIVAWDSDDNTAEGPLWDFTTMINPNNAPSLPEISGPTKGEPGIIYKYTIKATDIEQDHLYCYILWGDNTTTEWAGPFNSGESFPVTHSWTTKGAYTVKVKVRDEHGAESDWATLEVIMPTSQAFTHPFVHWLLEQFPHAFPLLRHLLGLLLK